MTNETFYTIMLYDNTDKWTYTDDHHRPVRFDSKDIAKSTIKNIFNRSTNISKACVIQNVTKQIACLNKDDVYDV